MQQLITRYAGLGAMTAKYTLCIACCGDAVPPLLIRTFCLAGTPCYGTTVVRSDCRVLRLLARLSVIACIPAFSVGLAN
jgi:hypothetical protein